MKLNRKSNRKLNNSVFGGLVFGNWPISDKMVEELRFHSTGGTGFAAEQANNLFDNLTFRWAKIVGNNNAKNGPDRQVWFTPIQTKYYSTAKASVDAAFENNGHGAYRYITDNGTVMDLEVPKDQYDSAVELMRDKIVSGQVAGVTDPGQADEIVRSGHYTYNQAKNIARAGNVDSLKYDITDGAVVGLSVFGITSIISYSLMIIRGEDPKKAAIIAAQNGGKAGSICLASTVLAGQFSKACSTDFINTVGAGTIATSSTLIVLSAIDVAKVFSGHISAEKAARNLGCNAVGLFAGRKGYVIGSTIGTAICPGVGTVIGGLCGAYLCGSVARGLTESLLDSFFGNSDDKIRNMFNKELGRIAEEYLLTKEELDILCGGLVKVINEDFLCRLRKCSNPKSVIAEYMDKQAQNLIQCRNKVSTIRNVKLA